MFMQALRINPVHPWRRRGHYWSMYLPVRGMRFKQLVRLRNLQLQRLNLYFYTNNYQFRLLSFRLPLDE